MTTSSFKISKLLASLGWLGLSALVAQSPARSQDAEVAARFGVVVLGVAQDAGYPQAGCEKVCCKPAWENPQLKRFPTSIALVDFETKQRWLFDCTWQLPEQIRMLNQLCPRVDSPGIDGVFLTHAHMGHYTGLMHLGREVMGASQVPTYAMPRMQTFLRDNGPWSQLVRLKNIELKELFQDQAVEVAAGVTVTPLLVPHRDEYSETVGFLIEVREKVANPQRISKRRVLYLPDIDKWSRWETRIEDVIATVDVAFVDATFFGANELPGRDMSEIPHPFVEESIQRLQSLPASERAKVHFIHFNHSNPALSEDSSATHQIRQAGMHIARQGQVIRLEMTLRGN